MQRAPKRKAAQENDDWIPNDASFLEIIECLRSVAERGQQRSEH